MSETLTPATLPAAVDTSTRHLYGWSTFAEAATTIRAGLFGVLANLAWPVVEQYRGDLFHDAGWLTRYVDGPTTFYFAVRECGTAIGTDLDLVRYGNDRTYRVELAADYGRHLDDRAAWTATVTPLDVNGWAPFGTYAGEVAP